VYPALHLQLLMAALPAGELLSGKQL